MSLRKKRRRKSKRRRIGRVSYYLHHGAWWIYYHDGKQQIRRRVADTAEEAERVAAQINSQLATASPTFFAFKPIAVRQLRRSFLQHHEEVLRSSVNTVRRYRAATQHLENFSIHEGKTEAHELNGSQFAAFLRHQRISPNGHPNTSKRQLRDKGVRFIMEVCRGMYNYAGRMRHLPPYAKNPFSDLQLDRLRIQDSKPVFVFDAETELAFLHVADDWAFPIHFGLAKTGLRPGELAHLLIEDVDLDAGWLIIRNRPELGWRIKTGCERKVPIIPELVTLLQTVIGDRTAGPVFLRQRYHCGDHPPLINQDSVALTGIIRERQAKEEIATGHALNREAFCRLTRAVWRDAGAIRTDAIRTSFLRITNSIGHPEATCAKSWRHTFATLLQDANVDPLIRQITLGHKPSVSSTALGMTAHYTHTRPETQRLEIERALRLWPRSLDLIHSTHGGEQ